MDLSKLSRVCTRQGTSRARARAVGRFAFASSSLLLLPRLNAIINSVGDAACSNKTVGVRRR